MQNKKGDNRDKNEDFIWQTLQKALRRIDEQDRIIKSLSLYILKNEKEKDRKVLVKQKRSKNN
jgi:hypothetical protein